MLSIFFQQFHSFCIVSFALVPILFVLLFLFVFNSLYLLVASLHFFSFIRERVRIWIGFIGSIGLRVFFLFSFYPVTNIVCCKLHTHIVQHILISISNVWFSVHDVQLFIQLVAEFFLTIFCYFSLIFCIWCQDSDIHNFETNRRRNKKILENASEMSKTRKRF